MIDLNDMLLFTQVVDAGSFTAAAKELGMPKSTLSRRISKLESQLNCLLLQRTTRSLSLTEIGADFYRHSLRMVAEAKEAERVISLNREEPCGLLRVTAPPGFGNDLLGSLVADFLRQYPEVRLELDISNRFVDLVEEGFDLALRAGHLEDSSLIARRLGESRMVVCASPDYLQQHEPPQTPEQLHDHDCLVHPGTDGRITFQFSGPNRISRIELEGKLIANSMSTLQEAAIAGLGIALLPWRTCREHVERGELQMLLEEWQLPTGGIYAVYPSPRYLTPKVRSFIDFIAERL